MASGQAINNHMSQDREMQSAKLNNKASAPSTQRYLDMSEIRDGAVIMKDGTLRAVILVSSINFALKSEPEQEAIIGQYVTFLNALDFPVQIVVQSRRLDIDNYLARLQDSAKNQPNELLKLQIKDYKNFIQELVSLGQIMQKQFFVVVPYNPLSDKSKNFWSRCSDLLWPAVSVKLAEEKFRDHREVLVTRAGQIMGHLQSMGLSAVMLDTQGLIELYYRVYNPESFDTQKMVNTEDLRVSDNQNMI